MIRRAAYRRAVFRSLSESAEFTIKCEVTCHGRSRTTEHCLTLFQNPLVLRKCGARKSLVLHGRRCHLISPWLTFQPRRRDITTLTNTLHWQTDMNLALPLVDVKYITITSNINIISYFLKNSFIDYVIYNSPFD